MSTMRLHITQGEHATAGKDDTVITTLLGSCVACCLWDATAGVGGMNHMLLTRSNDLGPNRTLSGINAMEVLINELIKLGAERKHLKAKAFGGARMIHGLSDIGAENAEFTVSYLAKERIPLITQSFGGTQARNLRFWPATGRVMQKVTDATVQDVEVDVPPQTGHGVELF